MTTLLMVSSQDKQKVRERLDTFEYLLENDEFVQKQRALGFSQGKVEGRVEGKVEGELVATRQVLQVLVKKLYPSLVALAEQRAGQTQKVDALRTVIGLIVEAHDEATARAVLDSLLTA
jgi:flagellar biosynthesis/type III secretory pathway protein FliH